MCKSYASDLVVSNNAIIVVQGDSHFWDPGNNPVVGQRVIEYLGTYFALNYPGSNIYVFNFAASGETMDKRTTNDMPAATLGIIGYQSNNFQRIGISQSTDNGALSSNLMYVAQSNVFQFPINMSPGNYPLVAGTGWAATHPMQWIGLGYAPAQSADGDPAGELTRNNAGTNAGWTLGIRGVSIWWELANGWTNNFTLNGGLQVQWSTDNPAHFFSGGALDYAFAIINQLTTDTNISTCTVAYNTTIVATNHCVVSSVARAGTTLSFVRHDDRLPFAYDMPTGDGTITNDCSGAFILNPANASKFHFDVTITGLPPGTYNLGIDGTTVGTYSDTQFGAGINMFTNMTIGPYAAQRREVLGLERDKDYVDRKTLRVGSAGDHKGIIQYGSNAQTQWAAGKRNDDLIAALDPFAKIVFDAAALEGAAAIPTNHTFSITLQSLSGFNPAPFGR